MSYVFYSHIYDSNLIYVECRKNVTYLNRFMNFYMIPKALGLFKVTAMRFYFTLALGGRALG